LVLAFLGLRAMSAVPGALLAGNAALLILLAVLATGLTLPSALLCHGAFLSLAMRLPDENRSKSRLFPGPGRNSLVKAAAQGAAKRPRLAEK
jgi:hypothetical protein